MVARTKRISRRSKIDELELLADHTKQESLSKPYYESAKKLTECKYCVFDGVFEHDGVDPTNKKGVWKKNHKRVCTVKHSLRAQNNKGVWLVCDKKKMNKCHFYEPE